MTAIARTPVLPEATAVGMPFTVAAVDRGGRRDVRAPGPRRIRPRRVQALSQGAAVAVHYAHSAEGLTSQVKENVAPESVTSSSP